MVDFKQIHYLLWHDCTIAIGLQRMPRNELLPYLTKKWSSTGWWWSADPQLPPLIASCLIEAIFQAFPLAWLTVLTRGMFNKPSSPHCDYQSLLYTPTYLTTKAEHHYINPSPISSSLKINYIFSPQNVSSFTKPSTPLGSRYRSKWRYRQSHMSFSSCNGMFYSGPLPLLGWSCKRAGWGATRKGGESWGI